MRIPERLFPLAFCPTLICSAGFFALKIHLRSEKCIFAVKKALSKRSIFVGTHAPPERLLSAVLDALPELVVRSFELLPNLFRIQAHSSQKEEAVPDESSRSRRNIFPKT